MEFFFGGSLFVAFFGVIMAVSIAGFVFWIFKLIEVAQIPDYQFRGAGSEKVTWVLVVALAGWIGALIWHFAKREDVLAAAGRVPGVPPGWYQDPTTSSLWWWDGSSWGQAQQP